MTTAIKIDGVSKCYRSYKESYSSFKERILHFGKIPYDDFWALKDISFEIETGTTVAFLGHNGSGKSTLLKCIAGIQRPTTGEIRTRGRLASMLELGAGFHPDLTGRENVFLNASLLGLPRVFVEKKFDEIVAFAELEDFIDNQVKHYSSGMYVRLGFAIAVNMDPEILLVDEVLAVGDELFQRKCLDRIRTFQREGRTIVVVSHAVETVRQICDRAAVLHHGDLVALDSPGKAIREYREHLLRRKEFIEAEHGEWFAAGTDEALPFGEKQENRKNLKMKITGVTVDHPQVATRTYVRPGEPLDIRIAYEAAEPISDVTIGISIHDLEGRVIYGANTDSLDVDLGTLDGPGTVNFHLDEVHLLDGDFPITVGAVTHDGATVYDWHDQRYRFSVMNPERSEGLVHLPFKISVHAQQPQS